MGRPDKHRLRLEVLTLPNSKSDFAGSFAGSADATVDVDDALVQRGASGEVSVEQHTLSDEDVAMALLKKMAGL